MNVIGGLLNQYSVLNDMYSSIIFWTALASIAGVLLKFWFMRSMVSNIVSPFAKSAPMTLESQREKNRHERAKVGMIIGAIAILGGLLLFLRGYTAGGTNVKVPGAQIENAAPGTVFCFVGMMIIYFTRSKD